MLTFNNMLLIVSRICCPQRSMQYSYLKRKSEQHSSLIENRQCVCLKLLLPLCKWMFLLSWAQYRSKSIFKSPCPHQFLQHEPCSTSEKLRKYDKSCFELGPPTAALWLNTRINKCIIPCWPICQTHVGQKVERSGTFLRLQVSIILAAVCPAPFYKNLKLKLSLIVNYYQLALVYFTFAFKPSFTHQ